MFKINTNIRHVLTQGVGIAAALALVCSGCSNDDSGEASQTETMTPDDGPDEPGPEDMGDDMPSGGSGMSPGDGTGGEPGGSEGMGGGTSGGGQSSGGMAGAGPAAEGPLEVVSVSPTARSLVAGAMAPLVIEFNKAVDPETVTGTSLWAFGRWSGPVRDGEYTYSDDMKTVTLTSPRPWTAGDRVTVILSHDLAGGDGETLRPEGYSFQFWTSSKPAPMEFELVETLSTGTERTIAYGGSAADLNGDSFLDLMVINEESADMRVFMNKGTGTGEFELMEETFPLDERASPSEPTDFDGDGKVDIVVANLDGDNLSILFGNGDGTFEVSQKIAVGDQPRGVAVFDFDGDGDIDIVNTNASSDNMSVLLNDGEGKFPEVEGDEFYFFDAGNDDNPAAQEWGLMSGDMNEDGILDMVIGARGRTVAGEVAEAGVVIWSGLGNGKFEFASMSGPLTMPWQLAVGDLNGDGHEDVATADGALSNASRNTVTMLLGDGESKLEPEQTYSEAIQQPFAIDVGDLDGDGDLDVVVSNFSADWEVLVNDGTSKMTLSESFESDDPGGVRGSASCALLMDIDNDGDLDLALIDENEDQVTFMKH